jgi:hypothetical protein
MDILGFQQVHCVLISHILRGQNKWWYPNVKEFEECNYFNQMIIIFCMMEIFRCGAVENLELLKQRKVFIFSCFMFEKIVLIFRKLRASNHPL